jgi:hypothetical protein
MRQNTTIVTSRMILVGSLFLVLSLFALFRQTAVFLLMSHPVETRTIELPGQQARLIMTSYEPLR